MLIWLVATPSVPVREVRVSGLHRLTRAEVVAAAGLDGRVSVFSVDAATIQRKLTAMPWVRSAAITATLPDRVALDISEWQPVAVYQADGAGKPFYLSSQAVALGPAGADPGALLAITGPPGGDPRPGRPVMDVRLLTALVNLQRGLPGLIGEEVRSVSVDCYGNVTMATKQGWLAYFGRVLTPEEFASLDEKLGALKALSGEVDLHSADLTYVNLMNPAAPAVGPARNAKPSAQPTPSPAPTGSKPVPSPSSAIQVVPQCR